MINRLLRYIRWSSVQLVLRASPTTPWGTWGCTWSTRSCLRPTLRWRRLTGYTSACACRDTPCQLQRTVTTYSVRLCMYLCWEARVTKMLSTRRHDVVNNCGAFMWAPRVSPRRKHKFHERWRCWRGSKHLGHPWSVWFSNAAASSTRTPATERVSGDRHTNKQTNRWTSLSCEAPLFGEG